MKTGLTSLDNKTLEWNDGGATRRLCSVKEIEGWNGLPGECALDVERGGDKFTISTATEKSSGHVVIYTQPFRTHWIDFGADFHASIKFGLRVLKVGWDKAVAAIEQ